VGELIEITERLSALQAWELVESGDALIVDVRGPSEFACGHSQGALSLPYSIKGLGDRLEMLVPSGTHIILMSEDVERTEDAVLQLHGGPFLVTGMVEGTMNDWVESGVPIEILTEVPIDKIAEISSGRDMVLLDVRESIEWDIGHVPGALLISLGTLRDRLHEIPKDAAVTVICEAGIRSSSAASILQAAGFIGVSHVPEGTGGYRNAGLPLQFPDARLD
jgi:hydroxyacylglutathione hydrolase